MRGGLAAALAFAAFVFPGIDRARARDRPRVVVVASPDAAGGSLARRMRAELETMGFDARVVAARSNVSADGELDDTVRGEQAVAAVQVLSENGTSKVLLFDQRTGDTVVRELERPPAAGAQAALAIQAVEVLRTSLLALVPADVPSPEVVPARPAPPAASSLTPIAARPPSLASAVPPPVVHDRATPVAVPLAAAEVGLGLLGSLGGLSPIPALAITAGVFTGATLRVGALALLPLASMRYDAAEGSSQSRVTIVAVDARAERRGEAWRASLGGGVAGAILATEGRSASALYKDQTATRAAIGPYLRPGAAYRFRRELVIRAELAVGWQPHPFALVYAGREVARWGAPWGAGWIALEARFP